MTATTAPAELVFVSPCADIISPCRSELFPDAARLKSNGSAETFRVAIGADQIFGFGAGRAT